MTILIQWFVCTAEEDDPLFCLTDRHFISASVRHGTPKTPHSFQVIGRKCYCCIPDCQYSGSILGVLWRKYHTEMLPVWCSTRTEPDDYIILLKLRNSAVAVSKYSIRFLQATESQCLATRSVNQSQVISRYAVQQVSILVSDTIKPLDPQLPLKRLLNHMDARSPLISPDLESWCIPHNNVLGSWIML